MASPIVNSEIRVCIIRKKFGYIYITDNIYIYILSVYCPFSDRVGLPTLS